MYILRGKSRALKYTCFYKGCLKTKKLSTNLKILEEEQWKKPEETWRKHLRNIKAEIHKLENKNGSSKDKNPKACSLKISIN